MQLKSQHQFALVFGRGHFGLVPQLLREMRLASRSGTWYGFGMTDFQKGQTVTFAEEVNALSSSGYKSRRTFQRGDTAEVTTVRKNTITVKVANPNFGNPTSAWGGRDTTKFYSYNVTRSSLVAPNGEAWDESAKPPKPKIRKIGEVPEGGIAPDDPRLAWLWDDAAKVADRSGYCSYYDRIAEQLDIPGRVRDIGVSIKHNGVTLTATVKARTRKEAEVKIRESLGLAASA